MTNSLAALSTKGLLSFVLFLSVASPGASDFLLPAGLDVCQDCCAVIGLSNDFSSIPFDVAACLTLGCNRDIAVDQLCTDLTAGDLTDGERVGCEIGRDLRFTGITSLLDPERVNLFQCKLAADVPVVEPISVETPNAADFLINGAACEQCCLDVNSAVDGGQAGEPNDFGRDSCVQTCANPDTCFDDDFHINRAGCLVALDFITQGAMTLDPQNKTFLCDSNGVFSIIDATAFPTSAPIEPTESPTVSPTLIPTVSPTSNPTTVEVENNGGMFVIIGIAAGSSGFIIFVIVIFAYVCGKRSTGKKRREASNNPKHLLLQQPRTEDTGPVHKNSALRDGTVVLEIHIPKSELDRDSFNLSKLLPAAESSLGHKPSIAGSSMLKSNHLYDEQQSGSSRDDHFNQAERNDDRYSSLHNRGRPSPSGGASFDQRDANNSNLQHYTISPSELQRAVDFHHLDENAATEDDNFF